MTDGELTQDNVAEIGFRISQSENDKGQTVYKFYDSSFTVFEEIPLGKDTKVRAACQHLSSFILQMASWIPDHF